MHLCWRLHSVSRLNGDRGISVDCRREGGYTGSPAPPKTTPPAREVTTTPSPMLFCREFSRGLSGQGAAGNRHPCSGGATSLPQARKGFQRSKKMGQEGITGIKGWEVLNGGLVLIISVAGLSGSKADPIPSLPTRFWGCPKAMVHQIDRPSHLTNTIFNQASRPRE